MKCIKADCESSAELALKLEFYYSKDGDMAPAYLNLCVCALHPMPDEETLEFLSLNWPVLAMSFERSGQEPVQALTKWKWVPLQEAAEFWEEGMKRLQHTETKPV